MPNCKYCGSRLSKFDKDICPVCGAKNPLEGVASETVEITSQFSFDQKKLSGVKTCTKGKTYLLFALLGWTGAPYFYLHLITQALMYMFINVIVIAGVGAILTFLTNLEFYGFLVSAGCVYLFNILFGIIYINKPGLKDGRGEFLH